jgi:hypothetical protein
METIRSINPNANGAAVAANSPAPARVPALPPAQRLVPAQAPAAVQTTRRPPGQGLAAWDNQMQDEVARAQQALDYLDSLESQLESIKGDLAARLSGARGGRQLETRIRQLGGTLQARRKNGGGSVDAKLNFTRRPATQSFKIRGLDIAAIKAAGTRALAFTVGGGPQVNVNLDPDMSSQEIAQQFDRALAPLGIHAGLDDGGQLLFNAPEASWAAVKDAIVLVGAGRVTAEEAGSPSIAPESWDTGNTETLRQSLREVVQALARVRQSQQAARAALTAAVARTSSEGKAAPEEVHEIAKDFASTANNTDYDSLIAITSALVGVSRERVLALLGLR